jgi:hypothetical protein
MKWTEHKLLPIPTDEEVSVMEPNELLEFYNLRETAIQNEAQDPYYFGYELPSWKRSWEMWKDYRILLLLGANRSSKSEFGAKTVVRAAMENPKSLIYCFSQNEETSLTVQQPAIYRYLPANLKTKSTSSVQYISYKVQTGFAERSLIFPNGSRIIFKFYSQWQQDDKILEGMALGSPSPGGLNVGAWLDEYLLGMDLLDRLYLRLATYSALMLLTFTPKDGITETVNNFIKDAVTIESGTTKVLNDLHGIPEKEIPITQSNKRKAAVIVYFHTEHNPWGGYQEVVEICRSKSDWKYTITALYGVPTKSYDTKFAKFSKDVNVVKNSAIPTSNITRWQIIDPAGRKSWFKCWIAVDVSGTWWVYREYPGIDIGEWAKQGKNGKWLPGEGAKGRGEGLKDYIEASYQMEGRECPPGSKEWVGGEDIFERIIDPRLSASKYQKADGESSILEDLDELGFVVTPAPGNDIEDGLQKLIDLMSYDTSKEIDGINRPHFYISEDCQNIIQALSEYTGNDGLKEAWKDPIDVLRYAAIADIDHVDQKQTLATARSTGGY